MRSFCDDRLPIVFKVSEMNAHVDRIDLEDGGRRLGVEPSLEKVGLELVELCGVRDGKLVDEAWSVRMAAELLCAVDRTKIEISLWL